jgi:citrate lyase beta subunit
MPCRSLLFVPALRPERVAKAIAAGADIVCVDLEDSVAPDRKAEARPLAIEALRTPGGTSALAVRINPVRGPEGPLDIAMLVKAGARPDYVVVPKIDKADDVALVRKTFGGSAPPLVALIETAVAVDQASEIARAVAPAGMLFFGAMDMSAELGCTLDWEPLVFIRGRLVQAAAAAGIGVLDTPYPDIADEAGGAAEARRARQFGFAGKAAIHPRHLAGIHAAFTPTAAEIAWARRVIEAMAASSGVLQLDGKMIDRPVVRAAERTLAIAERLGL